MAWRIYRVDWATNDTTLAAQPGTAHIYADSAADLPTVTQITAAGCTPLTGSDALDVSTGAQYRMDSAGVWHLQMVTNADIIAQLTAVQQEISRLYNDIDSTYAAAMAAYDYDTSAEYQIQNGDDLDDYNDPGAYACTSAAIAASLTNCPFLSAGFRLECRRISGIAGEQSLRAVQTIYTNMTGATGQGFFFSRTRTSAGWGTWYKYTGVSV